MTERTPGSTDYILAQLIPGRESADSLTTICHNLDGEGNVVSLRAFIMLEPGRPKVLRVMEAVYNGRDDLIGYSFHR